MGVNRLNPVQKATYFLKKSEVGKNKEKKVWNVFPDPPRVPTPLLTLLNRQ